MFRFAVLCLAVALAACAKPPEEHRFLDWRLEDDLAIYRAQPTTNPERLYRVGELSDALSAPDYQSFLEQVAKAPAGRRAFIYYEVSGANGVYFFALAVEGHPCRIVATFDERTYEESCSGFSTFEAFDQDVRIPIRDPVVAGLVQYEPGRAPIRTMTLGSVTQEGKNPLNGDFIAKVRQVFSRRQQPTQ